MQSPPTSSQTHKSSPGEHPSHWAATFQLFIYLFVIFWVSVAACRLSLFAAGGGYSLAAVHKLVASLVAEHRLKVHRLSCSEACGLTPDQGSNSIPRTGRQILIHCTTREVLKLLFNDISNTQLDSASEKAKLVSQAKIPFEACLYLALLLSLPS